MTLYVIDVTVPANTAQTSPKEVQVEIEEEVVVSVECHFPPGCRGMVYTAVYYGEEQIFPRPHGSYLHGDGETIRWQEYYTLPSKPCTLTIRAWSPGTNYDHTITWRINALPKNIAKWWLALDRFIGFLAKVFRVRV